MALSLRRVLLDPRQSVKACRRNPKSTLSGFGDEAANQKTAVQQFAALAAVGLQYYSLRFIDAGEGIKNVMKLSKGESRPSAISKTNMV